MYNSYIRDAEKLEAEAKRLRQTAKEWEEAHDNIHIGSLIRDLDDGFIKEVFKLKNGSNDFEARTINSSEKRGYKYTVNNWELLNFTTEIALNKSIDVIYNIIRIVGAGRPCPPNCMCNDEYGCCKESIKASLFK